MKQKFEGMYLDMAEDNLTPQVLTFRLNLIIDETTEKSFKKVKLFTFLCFLYPPSSLHLKTNDFIA